MKKKEYIDYIQSTNFLQIRLVSLLTSGLYILYSLIDRRVLSNEILDLAIVLHLYIVAPLLFSVFILSFISKFKEYIPYFLMFVTISAALANQVLISNVQEYTIYLTELYLMLFWVFTISGLNLIQALITAGIIVGIKITWLMNIFILPANLFYMDIFWLFSVCSFGILIGLLFEHSKRTIRKKNKALKKLSETDSLTKLFNRRKFDETISREIIRCKSFNHTFGLILLDIDYFKRINDQFGHQMGDEFLIELSELLKNSVRTTDLVVRWGGEEFIILCFETSFEDTVTIAEALKDEIEERKFKIPGKRTASFGVTAFKENDTSESLINRVDETLYKAKNSGRNRVESKK